MSHNRGATPDIINALPCYKFKYKRGQNGDDNGIRSENMDEVGILAAGTDKERLISAEDTVSFQIHTLLFTSSYHVPGLSRARKTLIIARW